MKRILNQFAAVAVLFSVITLYSCEKDKKESAPLLPSVTALAIDVDVFTAETPTKSVDPKSNFHVAVGAVSYWNLVLSTSLIVPVAAYAEAFNHDAERVDNDTWKWTYEVNEMYAAELVADVINDSIYLKMSISKTGVYEDLVWFTGKCDILRTGGEWTIYDIPVNSTTAWLTIKWNADYTAETFDIRYTNVYPRSDYMNSYIEYGITNATDYNAYYNLYNSTNLLTYEIGYNTETHVGYVSGDGQQYCWDLEYNNSICPGTN